MSATNRSTAFAVRITMSGYLCQCAAGHPWNFSTTSHSIRGTRKGSFSAPPTNLLRMQCAVRKLLLHTRATWPHTTSIRQFGTRFIISSALGYWTRMWNGSCLSRYPRTRADPATPGTSAFTSSIRPTTKTIMLANVFISSVPERNKRHSRCPGLRARS